jgi:hypothetical protein
MHAIGPSPRQQETNFDMDIDSMIDRNNREDVMPAHRSAHVQPASPQQCDWVGIGFRLLICAFCIVLLVGCVLGYGAAITTRENKNDINRLRIQLIKMSSYLNISSIFEL